eukprot:4949882-Amphidinium_carterae.1
MTKCPKKKTAGTNLHTQKEAPIRRKELKAFAPLVITVTFAFCPFNFSLSSAAPSDDGSGSKARSKVFKYLGSTARNHALMHGCQLAAILADRTPIDHQDKLATQM